MDSLAIKRLSAIEEVAHEFIALFQMREQAIAKCTSSGAVSPNFFCQKDEKPGFLSDLLGCCHSMGIESLSDYVKPELTPNRQLPIRDFAMGISTLGNNDLLKLKELYGNMESCQGKGEASFPPEFGMISKYFATAEKANNDSAEAGRLILMLSSISDEMIKLKADFKEYTPKTVDKFQETYLIAKENSLSGKSLLDSDRSRKAIEYMLANLHTKVLSMVELKKMVSRLKRQKREFLKLIISFNQTVREQTGDQISNAIRNLNTWLDWEILVADDKQAEMAIASEDFAKQLSGFKRDLQQYVNIIEDLSNRIKYCVQRKEVIGGYFYDVLQDVDVFIKRVMEARIYIDPSLKVDLRRLSYLVTQTERIYKVQLDREADEMSKFPEVIRKRVEYFSQEIPEVLCRGNAKEVKYMTLSVNASYINIEKSLRFVFSKMGRDDLVDQVCRVIRKRYTEIVKNATTLVRVESQAS